MSLRFAIALLFSILYLAGPQDGAVVVSLANEQETPNRPGLTPYTPTKIEWLALKVNSVVQHEASIDYPYSLGVAQADHETLLILVRYDPTVNREIMKSSIQSARELIMIMAKSYGWDKWVKIRERVEIYPIKK